MSYSHNLCILKCKLSKDNYTETVIAKSNNISVNVASDSRLCNQVGTVRFHIIRSVFPLKCDFLILNF